ncbi:MAG: ABC transporter substrate-binding protein [Chloroflexota bacterium]
MNPSRLPLLGLIALLLTACAGLPLPPEAAAAPTPTTQTLTPQTLAPQATPTLSPEPPQSILNVCAGSEPADLFIYNEASTVKRIILAAIYDGPIDYVNYGYQPVILEKLPSLADGDALIEPYTARQGDQVMDSAGNLAVLEPGLVVRPAGCRSTECAVAYEGGDFQMDRLRVVFHLRQDVLWQDGEPVKAWDSVFSYRVASDPETLFGGSGLASGSASSLLFTANYSALDDFTVQWTGVPGFLDPNYPLDFFSPLPEHILTIYTLSDLLASNEALYQPRAWGAYQVVSWEAGEAIVLEPNPFYFRQAEGLPHFDQVVFHFIGGDTEANIASLQPGLCDLILPDALPEALELSMLEMVSAGTARLHPDHEPVFEYLVFDIAPADPAIPPLFADARARQALALCLDRTTLTDAVYASFVPALLQPLPVGDPLLAGASLTIFDSSPAEGMALLDEIGWRGSDGSGIRQASNVLGVPDGTPLQFTLTSTDAPLRDQVGRWITFQLQACGMSVTVSQFPAHELLAQTPEALLSGRRFDLAEISSPLGVESLCALAGTAEISSEANGWSGTNLSGYSNPDFDAACAAARVSLPGTPEYTTSRQEVLRIFSQDIPLLPLFVQTRFLLAVPGLSGLDLPGGLQAFESFRLEP